MQKRLKSAKQLEPLQWQSHAQFPANNCTTFCMSVSSFLLDICAHGCCRVCARMLQGMLGDRCYNLRVAGV